MKVGALKEFIKDMDDDVEIRTVNGFKMLPTVKHVHLSEYIDGSGGKMLVFCPMGTHVPDTIDLIKGTH